jgi:hypothetical protein
MDPMGMVKGWENSQKMMVNMVEMLGKTKQNVG